MATIKELYKQSVQIIDKEETCIFNVLYLPDLNPDVCVESYDPLFNQFRCYYNEMLVPSILLNCGHFNSVYNSVEELAEALEIWSKTRAGVWSDLVRTTVQHYNLIHNYDRTEEWTERRANLEKGSSSNKTTANSENNTNTTINTSEENSATSGGNSESVKSVSAFDSTDYQPREKTTNDGESTNTSSGSVEQTVAENGTVDTFGTADGSYTKDTEDDFQRSIRAFGNIGVTTAQQMLEEERKLVQFNIVDHIVKEFKQNFCIMVY